MTSNLDDLIARVEAAGESYPKLNADVLTALGWTVRNVVAIDPKGDVARRIPDMLSSIDDAMAIVPEGWRIQHLTERLVPQRHVIVRLLCWNDEATGKAATIALAITAAALRARKDEK